MSSSVRFVYAKGWSIVALCFVSFDASGPHTPPHSVHPTATSTSTHQWRQVSTLTPASARTRWDEADETDRCGAPP